MFFVHFDPFDPEKCVKSQAVVAPIRCIHDANLVTAGHLLAEMM